MSENLQDVIARTVAEILKEKEQSEGIRVGVSARHVHLSREDLNTLFGEGYELTPKKKLMGDQYAAEECVTLVSPSLRSIEGVRVLGPVRSHSQVEVSRTDTFKLKISPPVRPSGDIKGSAAIALVGPKGNVFLNEGCIIANRHIHMTPADAKEYGIKDNDIVDVEIKSSKPTRFYNVQVRVREDFDTEMHIDTDDANACAIKTGDYVKILDK
ncbi:MAG: phosphate propanoyltransferase [Clostridiales bacterium]|nr:phosphate propanoyltransferase [Clostridiales bacterium]